MAVRPGRFGRGWPQTYNKSGDGTVPYASLSWINSWHYPNVNVTHVPANNRIDLDALLDQFGEVRLVAKALGAGAGATPRSPGRHARDQLE